jgi:NADPH2:quinone reductase
MRIGNRAVPVPAAGELLIRVVAAGLNRGDIAQRQGQYPPPPGVSDILGLEVSGVVEALGAGAEGFRVGDRVCALLAGGGYAEFCVAPAALCFPVPSNLSMIEAASLPEVLFTVWTTVWDQARLSPGETLLVHGGASGIGTAAIQMAAALGQRVFTTAGGPEKCAVCRSLGADIAVNYKSEDFVEVIQKATGGRGVDVILDMVGGDYVPRNLDALAEHGRLVFISYLRGTEAQIDIRKMNFRRLTLIGSTLRSRSIEFKAAIATKLRELIWPLVASGRIKAVVDSTYVLADVANAHRRMESGTHTGKIVLRIGAEA